MTQLLGPRQNRKAASIYRNLNLTPEILTSAGEVLQKTLSNGPRTRNDIYTALETAGITTGEGRGLQIIKYWGQEGVLCIGPRTGKQQTFALLETWIPYHNTPSSEEGMAILARRYFKSHGPATLNDFMWWTNATKAEVVSGYEAVKSQFATETINGREYIFSPIKTMPIIDEKQAFLLPAFDEYTVAYADRTAVMETDDMKKVYYGINPNIIINGRAVGTWKRTFKSNGVYIQLLPFGTLSSEELTAIQKAAEKYGRFVGHKAILLP